MHQKLSVSGLRPDELVSSPNRLQCNWNWEGTLRQGRKGTK